MTLTRSSLHWPCEHFRRQKPTLGDEPQGQHGPMIWLQEQFVSICPPSSQLWAEVWGEGTIPL